MLLKIRFIKYVAILLASALIFVSCVDEPLVPPVERPYSFVKITNLSGNVTQLNITVDGQPLNTFSSLNGQAIVNGITQNSFTEYFTIESGSRQFVVTDQNGLEVLNQGVECNSFEENILVFTGDYSATEDDNYFSLFQVYNGVTYLDDYHQPQTSATDTNKVNLTSTETVVGFIHAMLPTAANLDEPKIIDLSLMNNSDSSVVTYDLQARTGGSANELVFENYFRDVKEAGTYTATFTIDNPVADSADFVVTSTQTLTANRLCYFVAVGDIANPSIMYFEEPILAARPK